MFVVSGSETFSSSVDSFLVGDFLKGFDCDLTIIWKSQKQFQILLKSVRLFLCEDWKGCSILQNLFEEIMICHIRSFFDGLACWNKWFSIAFLDHSHKVAYDLGEVLCESVDVRHWEPKNIYKKMWSVFNLSFNYLKFDWSNSLFLSFILIESTLHESFPKRSQYHLNLKRAVCLHPGW